jgi:hypothetical protein
MSTRRVLIGGAVLVVLAVLAVGIVQLTRSGTTSAKSGPTSQPAADTPASSSDNSSDNSSDSNGLLALGQNTRGPTVPKIIPESLPPKHLSPSEERQAQRNQPALLHPKAPKGHRLAIIPSYLTPILAAMDGVDNLTAIVSDGSEHITEAYVDNRICAEGQVEQHVDSQFIWGAFIPPITNRVTIQHRHGKEIIRWRPAHITDATTTTVVVGADHRLAAVQDSTTRIVFSYGSASCTG